MTCFLLMYPCLIHVCYVDTKTDVVNSRWFSVYIYCCCFAVAAVVVAVVVVAVGGDALDIALILFPAPFFPLLFSLHLWTLDEEEESAEEERESTMNMYVRRWTRGDGGARWWSECSRPRCHESRPMHSHRHPGKIQRQGQVWGQD